MSNNTRFHGALVLLLTLALLSITTVTSSAQNTTKLEIEHWREVLRSVKRELKENYYDPTFRGIDIEARFKAADAKMKDAGSRAEMETIVAQVLLDLNDSQTFFIPFDDGSGVEYGWRLRAVGAYGYVSAVKPGSDAWAKGLRPGDKVLSIDGKPLDPNGVWLANYRYYTLHPEETVTLVIQKPDQTEQKLVVRADVSKTIGAQPQIYSTAALMNFQPRRGFRLDHHQFHELSDEVMVWKMPHFYLDEYDLADRFNKVRKRKALILDLRGNRRGFRDALPHLAGYFFDGNIKLADRRGRKDLKPIVAKSKKEKAFKGQLVVLIDRESASSAEIFARAVQVHKRGIVVGDRSSGSVMEGKLYPLQVGVMRSIPVAINIATADVIMPDGTRLEQVGVAPDKLVLPTAQEMSAHHDPVLAYAASLVGVDLDPNKAGELFATEWKRK